MAPVARPGVEAIRRWRLAIGPTVHQRSRPGDDLIARAHVVESCRLSRLHHASGVHELVRSCSADHAYEETPLHSAAHNHAIVPAVQVQSDLLGLRAIEHPVEVRNEARALVPQQPDPDAVVGHTFHLGHFRLVSRVDVHVMGEEPIETSRGGGQLVASPSEVACQLCPVQAIIFAWQAANRCGDDAVGQLCLQRPGGRVPDRLLQVPKQPTVEVLGSPAQPVDVAVVRAEADQLPVGDPGKAGKHSIEPGERLVAIARDRPPHCVVTGG